jgi:hypothetical protein
MYSSGGGKGGAGGAGAAVGGGLASTGSPVALTVAIGLWLLVAGFVALHFASRRRLALARVSRHRK